jgi:hypothetical protein
MEVKTLELKSLIPLKSLGIDERLIGLPRHAKPSQVHEPFRRKSRNDGRLAQPDQITPGNPESRRLAKLTFLIRNLGIGG